MVTVLIMVLVTMPGKVKYQITTCVVLLQALSGQAVDRHLMGLKLQAIEDQYNIPELFMDTSYAFATHYILSTNQVSLLR